MRNFGLKHQGERCACIPPVSMPVPVGFAEKFENGTIKYRPILKLKKYAGGYYLE
jgi:hypothetical protein